MFEVVTRSVSSFCGVNYNFLSKTTKPLCFPESYSLVMQLSKMLSKHCKIIKLKTFNCSEMSITSITNTALLKNERGSYKFMFSLKNVTIYWKKIL